MFKKSRFVFISVICVLISVICGYAQDSDSITIVTYYPSPYGVYREMRAQRMAIGEDYINAGTVCWSGDTNCPGGGIPTGPFGPDIDLVVEGNVGIGTTTPVAKLHVHNSASQGIISISGVSDGGQTYSALYLHDDIADTQNNNWVIAHKKRTGLIEEDDLHIARWINPSTTRIDMVIDSATGNVGIGTTGPDEKLQIWSGNLHLGDSASGQTNNFFYATEAGAGGNKAGFAVSQDNIGVGSFKGGFYGASGIGGIRFFTNTGDATSKISFGTTSNFTDYTNYNEKVTIDLAGNVGIGTTSPGGGTSSSILSIANKAAAAPTAVSGVSHLYTSGGEGYWMDAAGNATLQTPHDPVTGEWIFFSKNIRTGRVVRVDMERLVKAVERVTGEKFMVEKFEESGE